MRASEGECLLYIGKIYDAIERFEKVKADIKREVVFDKTLLYINICN